MGSLWTPGEGDSKASGWSTVSQVNGQEGRAEKGHWGQILLGLVVTLRTWPPL